MTAVNREQVFTNYVPLRSHKFAISLVVEFLGMLLFSFLGSTVTDKAMAAWVNGLALAVAIYIAANISGGHLNPAVTVAVFCAGFYPMLHSVLYIVLQVAGSICGSLIASALVPGASVGSGGGGPGCFDETVVPEVLTRGQLFGWEVVMTLTLISTVYACGIAKPGHGSLTPLAVGLSLVACAGAGGNYTGAALNPARVLGPLAVFHCGADLAWTYILAQLLAAVLACCVFAFVSGFGPLFPSTSCRLLGLSHWEAAKMWLSGAPPSRLLTNKQEGLNDVLAREEGRAGVFGATGLLGKGAKMLRIRGAGRTAPPSGSSVAPAPAGSADAAAV